MIVHTTLNNEVLDELCYRYHGNAQHIEAVLNQNPHLRFYGTHLPAGVKIEFEEIEIKPPREVKPIALWD